MSTSAANTTSPSISTARMAQPSKTATFPTVLTELTTMQPCGRMSRHRTRSFLKIQPLTRSRSTVTLKQTLSLPKFLLTKTPPQQSYLLTTALSAKTKSSASASPAKATSPSKRLTTTPMSKIMLQKSAESNTEPSEPLSPPLRTATPLRSSATSPLTRP